MADDQTPTTNTLATAAVISESTPVVATPAVSSETAASSSNQNPIAPVVETAAVVAEPTKTETPVADAKIENPLGEAKTEVKEEVKKTEEKPVENVAEVKTVELPTYEAFKTLENVKLEGDSLNEFTKILAEAEIGKLDHKGYQDFGQKLVDYGTKIVSDSINRLNDSYVHIHQKNMKTLFEALKADPELGGDKLPETISALQTSIGEYGGTEQQVADFRKEVTEAGLGASPAICRLIYNMQQKINKYTTEGIENRMVPGAKPAPSKVKDYMKFYS